MNLYKKVVDAMAAHVAILDQNGTIIETNFAWQQFGRENGMKGDFDTTGYNYLSICEQAATEEQAAGEVAEGIRQVLAGQLDEFLTHYPCHSPESKRWFAVRVVPFREAGEKGVIVTHENITPIIQVQEKLKESEAALRQERERLEETNTALRVLLRQREEDKTRLEETMYSNVDRLVLPYVERLDQTRLTEKQRSLLGIIDTNLREVISPFLRNLSSLSLKLTPQEIEVANMVRSGRSSKEIAELLTLSVAGVSFHRKQLRTKLGLTNSKINLRSYLLSLDE